MLITQITTVKGRSKELLSNLPKWVKSGVDEIIIVDYACPDASAKKLINSKVFKDKEIKVKILCVPEKVTGPFYSHEHARNLGAKAATGELFFFVNADVTYSSDLVGIIRDIEDNDIHPAAYVREEAKSYLAHNHLKDELPKERHLDDNFIIRNAVFYGINGYSEDNPGWGSSTYDLLIRAVSMSPKIKFLDFGLRHKDHGNEERHRFLPFSLDVNGISLHDNIYKSSYKMAHIHRQKSFRAQPGRAFAAVGEDQPLLLINSTKEYSYITY